MRNPATLPRPAKAAIVIATDAALFPIALWMAFGFRLGPLDPSHPLGLVDPLAWVEILDIATVWVGSICIVVGFRLYRIKLHAMDLDAIRRIALCSAAIAGFTAFVAFIMDAGFPRSVPILFGATVFVLMVLVRIAALQFFQTIGRLTDNKIPVAIYGAGSAGIQLATSLQRSSELQPTMFIDDNPALHNVIVSGIRVKPYKSLLRAASESRIGQVLVAIPSMHRSQKEKLVKDMRDVGCEVKVIPSYVDLISGKANVDAVAPINPDQLLGRDKVDLDTDEIDLAYSNQSIMVTGAGGSIGSELCRQLLACKPSQLILFERSEPALYEIERQLRPEADARNISLVAVLGSVTDRSGVDAALANNRVDVLLHAAAYKHVPLLEANEVEAARNNVLGTHTVVEAALAAELKRFILVSTDKAVRPTNVMGATKRLAELLVYDAQRRSKSSLFSLVRFGNVLGSSGSVVPLFAEQIATGGPVTITHPEVTRFFMTIPEAARLVLLAGAFATGRDLYVLDMGKPIKIQELAERMIELSGRTRRHPKNPEGDIEIKVVGLRPGEKLFEEVLVNDETLMATPHSKILRAETVGLAAERVQTMILAIGDAVQQRDKNAVRSIATDYVEGFKSEPEAASVIQFPGSRSH